MQAILSILLLCLYAAIDLSILQAMYSHFENINAMDIVIFVIINAMMYQTIKYIQDKD